MPRLLSSFFLLMFVTLLSACDSGSKGSLTASYPARTSSSTTPDNNKNANLSFAVEKAYEGVTASFIDPATDTIRIDLRAASFGSLREFFQQINAASFDWLSVLDSEPVASATLAVSSTMQETSISVAPGKYLITATQFQGNNLTEANQLGQVQIFATLQAGDNPVQVKMIRGNWVFQEPVQMQLLNQGETIQNFFSGAGPDPDGNALTDFGAIDPFWAIQPTGEAGYFFHQAMGSFYESYSNFGISGSDFLHQLHLNDSTTSAINLFSAYDAILTNEDSTAFYTSDFDDRSGRCGTGGDLGDLNCSGLEVGNFYPAMIWQEYVNGQNRYLLSFGSWGIFKQGSYSASPDYSFEIEASIEFLGFYDAPFKALAEGDYSGSAGASTNVQYMEVSMDEKTGNTTATFEMRKFDFIIKESENSSSYNNLGSLFQSIELTRLSNGSLQATGYILESVSYANSIPGQGGSLEPCSLTEADGDLYVCASSASVKKYRPSRSQRLQALSLLAIEQQHGLSARAASQGCVTMDTKENAADEVSYTFINGRWEPVTTSLTDVTLWEGKIKMCFQPFTLIAEPFTQHVPHIP